MLLARSFLASSTAANSRTMCTQSRDNRGPSGDRGDRGNRGNRPERTETGDRGDRSAMRTTAEPNPSIWRTRKLFVRNLPWELSWLTLKEHFELYGHKPGFIKMIKSPTGTSKGMGMISFEDWRSAANALSSVHGTEILGRTVLLSQERDTGFVEDEDTISRRVLLQGLPSNMRFTELKELFETVPVSSAMETLEDGTCVGLALLPTAEAAQKAVADLNGKTLPTGQTIEAFLSYWPEGKGFNISA